MNYTVGLQAVGTITTGASGTENVSPVRSNGPFKNLNIVVKPISSLNVRYEIDVYMYGELYESHSYPDVNGKVVAFLDYPIMFPANAGTDAIPKYFDPVRQDYIGVPISISITNLEATEQVFEVYALYESFEDNCRFVKVTQG